MKVFCISDNNDTMLGMRLCGIEGVVLKERDEILKQLDALIADEEIAIVLLTTRAIEEVADVVSNYKLNLQRPLLVEIPDRFGSLEIGETIDSYISDAIGIKL